MLAAGIDVGSRTVKLAILGADDGRPLVFRQAPAGFDPVSRCRELMKGLSWDTLVATGYGRRAVGDHFGAGTITEIQAHALGARRLFPTCRSVLDIGGQDTKAIALTPDGRVQKFEMNDRCAAGTGKFLEFMAASFQIPTDRFGDYALRGRPDLAINSMCTVFAESEATSLMARNERPEDIALALHESVVRRVISMMRRVCVTPPLVFSGGVARNSCVRALLERTLECPILSADEPEMTGALGAALSGLRNLGAV